MLKAKVMVKELTTPIAPLLRHGGLGVDLNHLIWFHSDNNTNKSHFF